ncbi:MAG: hypothetical protein K9J13_13015 [Saprospiraceae bacterium]|nr:hypothetical protein [Saprospiraceae bacterium]
MNKAQIIAILVIIILGLQNNYAQTNLIGSYGITDVKQILHNGDSVCAIYKPWNIVNVDRSKYPEYTTGLPDSFPNIPNGKYVLINTFYDTLPSYISEEGFYKNAVKEGIWKYYDRNGICIKLYNYKNGQFDGYQHTCDKNGKITSYWNIVDGVVHGKVKVFNEDELMYEIGEYNQGSRVGKFISWFPDIDSSDIYVEKYYDGLGKYIYAEKQYCFDTLIFELYETKRYELIFENGILTKKTNYRKASKEYKKSLKIKEENKKTTVLKNIYFDSTYSYLDTKSYKSLDDFIKVLKTQPNTVVELIFHTEYSVDDVEPNWVSELIDYLMNNGIQASKIYAKTYSNTIPLYVKSRRNRTNQRVEWRFMK